MVRATRKLHFSEEAIRQRDWLKYEEKNEVGPKTIRTDQKNFQLKSEGFDFTSSNETRSPKRWKTRKIKIHGKYDALMSFYDRSVTL